MPNGSTPQDAARAQKTASYASMDQAKMALSAQLPGNPAIQPKIDALIDQQTQLNLNYLTNATDATAVANALTQIQTATTSLNTEASGITTAANILNAATTIVNYATEIVGLFAMFA